MGVTPTLSRRVTVAGNSYSSSQALSRIGRPGHRRVYWEWLILTFLTTIHRLPRDRRVCEPKPTKSGGYEHPQPTKLGDYGHPQSTKSGGYGPMLMKWAHQQRDLKASKTIFLFKSDTKRHTSSVIKKLQNQYFCSNLVFFFKSEKKRFFFKSIKKWFYYRFEKKLLFFRFEKKYHFFEIAK